MAEEFETTVTFTGKVAKKFFEYDKDPWKFETPESLKLIKRAKAK